MKKKDAFQIAAAGLFFTTMFGIILFAFKKNKVLHHAISFNDINDEKGNIDSYSILSLHEKIEQQINEAAGKVKDRARRFTIPSGELGMFL